MFLSSNHGCVLEEMVFMELNITKKIHENDRKTILQDESIQSHINNNVDELSNILILSGIVKYMYLIVYFESISKVITIQDFE